MGKREKLMFRHIFFHRGQRSSTPFSLHPAPQDRTNRIPFKERMRSFLWISDFLSSFPDCHCLLGTVQVLLLLKAHTPALALPMEREVFSFRKGKNSFFTDDGEQNEKQQFFSSHISQPLSSASLPCSGLKVICNPP